MPVATEIPRQAPAEAETLPSISLLSEMLPIPETEVPYKQEAFLVGMPDSQPIPIRIEYPTLIYSSQTPKATKEQTPPPPKPQEKTSTEELLRTGGQMQPAPSPMRQSGSREEATTVVKEEKKKGK